MAERLIKTLTSEANDERVLILRRPDGVFTYRRQMKGSDGWGVTSLPAGLYDSAETAENEAREQVTWLVPRYH